MHERSAFWWIAPFGALVVIFHFGWYGNGWSFPVLGAAVAAREVSEGLIAKSLMHASGHARVEEHRLHDVSTMSSAWFSVVLGKLENCLKGRFASVGHILSNCSLPLHLGIDS